MEFNQKIVGWLACLILSIGACKTDDEVINPDNDSEISGTWSVTETRSQYDKNDILLSSYNQQSRLSLNDDQETGNYELLSSGGTGEIVYHYFSQDNKMIIGQIFPAGENTITTVFDVISIQKNQIEMKEEQITLDENGEVLFTTINRWELIR